MQVILSANVSHYYYTARALAKANYLKYYICAITMKNKQSLLYEILPEYWRKKLRGREVLDIDKQKIKSLWLPELLQVGLPRMHLISSERGNWINNYLYDWIASQWVGKCDIFHFVSSIGYYSGRKAKREGAILICDERTEYPDFQRQIIEEEYDKLEIKFNPPGLLYDDKIKSEYALSDYIILPSSYAKQTFIDAGFKPKKIFVVPYGINLQQFHPVGENYKSDNIFRIIYVGQIIPRKGVHYLIEAFERLKLSKTELLLIGPIDESMKSFIDKRTKYNSKIKAIGAVPKIELSKYYSRGSVFVLPSLADSRGLVVSEAMGCGLPVIVTENTGSKEIVRDGKDGFIIPIRDVDVLMERICFLYKNKSICKQMGKSSKLRVQEFTWQRYEEQILKVYKKVIQLEGINK